MEKPCEHGPDAALCVYCHPETLQDAVLNPTPEKLAAIPLASDVGPGVISKMIVGDQVLVGFGWGHGRSDWEVRPRA